ncbi:S9 family peptidase [Wenyingzhuangia sp. 2_MG-2023]|uniref:alpha/beta hydrolase family protein n=1 Tax=Wenyingzhuangia sp. 2_MG-2023 TaxID=3062639 RepID=UPI0026E3A025|nr:acetylxylan esterase [Wenyingzhuangia sp. 2_MG-2023]MDO6738213.1 acetylxylan esterase [Wenyingzhuangia sp. 2_MG-2023]
MKYYNLSIILILIFLFSEVYSYGQNDTEKGKHVGPEWIQKMLINDGVLSAPSHRFTKKYDQYKHSSSIRGMFFEGLPYKEKETKVFCWYGVPKTLKQGEKAPAVVLVHGGGGTAFHQWVQKWNNRGYIAISIALEGQVPGDMILDKNGQNKHPSFEFSGPSRIGFFNDVNDHNLQDQWFYHAVADIMKATSLLTSFPEVDAEKIGITGISWGGILTNVVTGIDNRYAFAIPVYGCGYLHETPLYKKIIDHLKPSQQIFYMENWEPSLYVPLHKQPTLFVNGTNDMHFTMNSFTKTFAASTNEKYLRIELEMKHGHSQGWDPKEIYNFADYVLKDGLKPVEISYVSISKKKSVLYRYTGEVKEVYLYYTTDVADWGDTNYKWTEIPVSFNATENTIKATLPNNTKVYFVNTISTEGLISSSKMRFVSEN